MKKWLRRKKFGKPTEESMGALSDEVHRAMEIALDCFDSQELQNLVFETKRLIDLERNRWGTSPEDVNEAGNQLLWSAKDLFRAKEPSAITTILAGAYLKSSAQAERLEAPKQIKRDIEAFLVSAPENSKVDEIKSVESLSSILGMDDVAGPLIDELKRLREDDETQ